MPGEYKILLFLELKIKSTKTSDLGAFYITYLLEFN